MLSFSSGCCIDIFLQYFLVQTKKAQKYNIQLIIGKDTVLLNNDTTIILR